MSDFASIFKNGGPNFSFGRVFAGLALVIGLGAFAMSVATDYNHPTKPVQISKFDLETKTAYVETVLVAEPNFSGYQSLLIGIAALATSIYGMSKLGGAAQTFADNRGSDPSTPPTQ